MPELDAAVEAINTTVENVGRLRGGDTLRLVARIWAMVKTHSRSLSAKIAEQWFMDKAVKLIDGTVAEVQRQAQNISESIDRFNI